MNPGSVMARDPFNMSNLHKDLGSLVHMLPFQQSLAALMSLEIQLSTCRRSSLGRSSVLAKIRAPAGFKAGKPHLLRI